MYKGLFNFIIFVSGKMYIIKKTLPDLSLRQTFIRVLTHREEPIVIISGISFVSTRGNPDGIDFNVADASDDFSNYPDSNQENKIDELDEEGHPIAPNKDDGKDEFDEDGLSIDHSEKKSNQSSNNARNSAQSNDRNSFGSWFSRNSEFDGMSQSNMGSTTLS